MTRVEPLPPPDAQYLDDLVRAIMPFGRYQGRHLYEIPEAYLVWMSREGFPRGKLGDQLRTILEIKMNGLSYLLDPLIARAEAERD